MVWGGSLAKEWDMGSSGVLCGPLKASWLWLSQVGDEGAGHFVKMVHNGIEYGDMQLICEAYHLMKDVLAMGHAEMAKVSLGRDGAEHSLALPFFGIGMTTDLFQSCGHC